MCGGVGPEGVTLRSQDLIDFEGPERDYQIHACIFQVEKNIFSASSMAGI